MLIGGTVVLLIGVFLIPIIVFGGFKIGFGMVDDDGLSRLLPDGQYGAVAFVTSSYVAIMAAPLMPMGIWFAGALRYRWRSWTIEGVAAPDALPRPEGLSRTTPSFLVGTAVGSAAMVGWYYAVAASLGGGMYWDEALTVFVELFAILSPFTLLAAPLADFVAWCVRISLPPTRGSTARGILRGVACCLAYVPTTIFVSLVIPGALIRLVLGKNTASDTILACIVVLLIVGATFRHLSMRRSDACAGPVCDSACEPIGGHAEAKLSISSPRSDIIESGQQRLDASLIWLAGFFTLVISLAIGWSFAEIVGYRDLNPFTFDRPLPQALTRPALHYVSELSVLGTPPLVAMTLWFRSSLRRRWAMWTADGRALPFAPPNRAVLQRTAIDFLFACWAAAAWPAFVDFTFPVGFGGSYHDQPFHHALREFLTYGVSQIPFALLAMPIADLTTARIRARKPATRRYVAEPVFKALPACTVYLISVLAVMVLLPNSLIATAMGKATLLDLALMAAVAILAVFAILRLFRACGTVGSAGSSP